MISIVDYGLGNVRAFENIYRQLDIPSGRVNTPDELLNASKIILPGVGSFDWAMKHLHDSRMLDVLNYLVIERKVPVLGVCVGMQIMARGSEEGSLPGLGWIKADVKRFDEMKFNHQTHLPHMGWNTVSIKDNCRLFCDIIDPHYYFLHSYYVDLDDADHSIGDTTYGIRFASAIQRDNIVATQFHPEKSHQWGVKLLQNFAGIS